ncbi:hypothetical protein O1611_g10495 [Lasiodiplodia mahajangana]|uniref:Uncharacterized protein n=1 Tax=Lasiodiplodia mahajangana TaxID=1108764 RepID=A0ACC2IXW2_9PEZI|nr:hypothetical protein O1611_g10495 [Lasiodiplodia mahajangana]
MVRGYSEQPEHYQKKRYRSLEISLTLMTRIRAVCLFLLYSLLGIGSCLAIRHVQGTTDADKSRAGNISVEEFAQVMAQSPGKPPSKEEVEQIIKEVDLDGDGSINFNEFITMMTGQPYPPPSQEGEEEYASAWKEYEKSLNGSITASQFRQLMAGLGEPVTDVEVEQLINNIDGEGKLSFLYVNKTYTV